MSGMRLLGFVNELIVLGVVFYGWSQQEWALMLIGLGATGMYVAVADRVFNEPRS